MANFVGTVFVVVQGWFSVFRGVGRKAKIVDRDVESENACRRKENAARWV